ncbi:MAG TPA: hypothetical protein VHH34_05975 [Pseudonocardiaceae bacterium]|nr:hypothetical protein [Pseudonocardiaceae bacterium]
MIAAVLLLAGIACSTGTSVPRPASAPEQPELTAQQAVTELVRLVPAAMPGTVFTPQTDPDHLLGQADSYRSKAAFFDSRIDPGTASADNGGIQRGGLVEVFADEQGAAQRMKYLQELGPPFGEEYLYASGPVLVRVANALTPWQASEYATALTEIAAGGAGQARPPA